MDDRISLLEYQIRLLHTMVTKSKEYNEYFFSFMIDHNISEERANLIVKALIILNSRMKYGGISDEIKDLFGSDELKELYDDSMPTFVEFSNFISGLFGDDINPEYLLKSLCKQGICKDLCIKLLGDKV